VGAAEFFVGIRRFEDRLFAFALVACVVGFLYSLYPLDIILSHGEWSEKIRLGRVQWRLTAHSNSTLEWAQGLIGPSHDSFWCAWTPLSILEI
jgi:hypothetical protein